jgi:hypothetical protein
MQLARSCRGAMVALAALGAALVAVGSAQADTKRISDGNDRPGRLDIRSASHGHDGARVVHTISTFSRWRPGLIGRNTSNLLAVEISTDGDPALERVVLVFSANGRLVAPIIQLPAGTVVGSASVSKPNRRTVRVSIRHVRLGYTAGYRWNAHSQYRAAGACSSFCIDRAPNSGRVLHDIYAPTIGMTSFPAVAPDTEYDVSFRISERGGAGLRLWQLQHRPFGTSPWTTVASGTATGLKTHHHVSAEDNDDQFRVVAVDRQGNRRVSPVRLVSVPIDDTSASLVYTGTWVHGAGDSRDFHDTLSSSSEFGDTVELTFTGRYVAWVAPGVGDEQDQGWIFTEGVSGKVVFLDFIGRRRIAWEHTFASVATRTLRIEVHEGTVPIDGIIVR